MSSDVPYFVDYMVVAGGVIAFYQAFAIGANDVANALGTSVGSGALSVKQGIILGAIFEFLGAFIMGQFVTGTIKKGLVDIDQYAGELDLFILGMTCALAATTVWLLVATYFALPVSTTHTIIGAIIGFSVVQKGFGSLKWWSLGQIGLSWVLSPVLGGAMAFALFFVTNRTVLLHPFPWERSLQLLPYFAGLSVAILAVFIVRAEGPVVGVHLPVWVDVIVAVVVFIITALIVWRLIVPFMRSGRQLASYFPFRLFMKPRKSEPLIRASTDEQLAGGEAGTRSSEAPAPDSHQDDVHRAEENFVPLMVLSAVFVAFGHGSNDVANAVGPFAAVIEYKSTATINPNGDSIPVWIIAMGGLGIVLGLCIWGHRVMKTVGEDITKLTYSRGYSAQLSTATVVMLASFFGLPISTTHTAVGSVTGIGLVPNKLKVEGGLDRKTLGKIIIAWCVTFVAGAGLCIVFYLALRAIFFH
eukprot:TRINITY_DN15236_c0_g1_i1.p1 TRINITY_DN15236_c0_g1~~TRINITY_DN15236_c0_g1_i1.p1  ORF type:complete len:472 (+),score=179.50 TRINITY_DN15236_c0_g1_i1:57-1472(+)